MKHHIPFIAIVLFAATGTKGQGQYKTTGKTEAYEPEFSAIVSPDAKIEVLATGLEWTEGPVWVSNGNYLLFSDTRANTIYRWDEEKDLQPFLKPSGYTGKGPYSEEPGSNGLLINNDGELVACEHGDRRITRMGLTTGGKITLADNYNGRRLNSPNDICQHSNGTYFFTDPPYGLPGREKDTENKEAAQNGVYSIDTKGNVKLLTADFKMPNGIALSPDEKTLYVGQSGKENPVIMEYPLQADNTLGKGRVFFDFEKSGKFPKTAPDGLKIDKNGNVYAAAANGIVVFTPKGKPLGIIETGVKTANCNFGTDGYLYITAGHMLCRIKLNK